MKKHVNGMKCTAISLRRMARSQRATISATLSKKNVSGRSRSKRKIKGDEDRSMKGVIINESKSNIYPHNGLTIKKREDKYLSRRLDIFEYAEQHKDCPEHTNEYEIGGKKYIVHSHFVGQKDIDKVLSEIAVSRALSEVLYNNADRNTSKTIA